MSETCIKISLLQLLLHSKSTPEKINDIKNINAIFSEGNKQFKYIEKIIKQREPSFPVLSLPAKAKRNIKKQTPVLPILVKPSQKAIVKVHRKAPPPPTVQTSHQQLTDSSLSQQQIENNQMKTSVLPVLVKSSQETKGKIHRKEIPPPTARLPPPTEI